MKDTFENNCLLAVVILTVAIMFYVEWSNPCAAWSDTPCEYMGK